VDRGHDRRAGWDGRRSRDRSLRALRRTLLEFAVSGHFTQISTRHAVHRYYQLALSGFDVQQLWNEARQAVADLDANRSAEQQLRLAEATNRSLESSLQTQRMMKDSLDNGVRMQKALHVIEVFLLAVYFAHLAFMLIETLHPHPWSSTACGSETGSCCCRLRRSVSPPWPGSFSATSWFVSPNLRRAELRWRSEG